jgi:intracellular multiplication protein IcmO
MNNPPKKGDDAVDSLVQQHPIVKAAKNEAKALKKSRQELSLMQAQSAVAKNKGFNNWHDLLQKIKLVFNRDFKYNQLISADKNEIPTEGYMHLGRSREFGLEQWINTSTARTHISIYEPTPDIDSIDVYLAEQALKNNSPLFFMSENQTIIEYLATSCISNKRHQLLYIFDYQAILGYQFEEYFSSVNPFSSLASGSMTELLFSLCRDILPREEMLKGKIIGFLSALSMALVYHQNQKNEDITWHHLSVINPFHFFEMILSDSSYPQHIQSTVKAVMAEKELIESLQFLPAFYQIISSYAKLAFSQSETSYKPLDLSLMKQSDKPQPVILILLPKRKEVSENYYYDEHYKKIYTLFLTHLKNKLSNLLGTKIDNDAHSYHDVIERKVPKQPFLFIMHDPYIIPGFAIMPAQSRSLGVSLVFCYSKKFDSTQNPEELSNVLANTNLNLFSQHAEDYSFFSQHYQKVKGACFELSNLNKNSNYHYNHHDKASHVNHRIHPVTAYGLKDTNELKDDEYKVFFKGFNQTIKLIKQI